uniref:RuvB-like helicase n=1 Tax=Panagrolaimus sp. JU765 TaxID=591449 RepID=A0AC34RT09_9BILA
MVDSAKIVVNEVPRVERIGVHSHISGLGLTENLEESEDNQGMVGQLKARKAAGLIVKMIKEGKIAGRAILITGEAGTGKTAIAMGISRALNKDTPFVSMTASEVFSVDMSKTEVLTQSIRKAVGVRISEKKNVLVGEVVMVETERPATGIGKRTGKITLKTTDMEAIFDVGSKMVESIIKERITTGDVIRIDRSNGIIEKLGRSNNRSRDFDVASSAIDEVPCPTGIIEKLGRSNNRSRDFDVASSAIDEVPCPTGEIERNLEVVDTVALHDIDAINSRAQGYLTVFSGDTGEIKSEIRDAVDQKMNEWREQERAFIIPGVLFIDEIHVLDLECFAFLNRAMEGEFAPIIVMATNRGMAKIHGTNIETPHGIPSDLLDRTLIVRTEPYSYEEVQKILRIRATVEGVPIGNEGLVVYDM